MTKKEEVSWGRKASPFFLIFFAAVFLFGLWLVWQRPPLPPQPVNFESKEEGFSAEFIGTPSKEEARLETPFGEISTTLFFSSGQRGFYYKPRWVAVDRLPEGILVEEDDEALLSLYQRAVHPTHEGEVEPDRWRGVPSLSFELETTLESRWRFLLKRPYLYRVGCGHYGKVEDCDAFFESFHWF